MFFIFNSVFVGHFCFRTFFRSPEIDHFDKEKKKFIWENNEENLDQNNTGWLFKIRVWRKFLIENKTTVYSIANIQMFRSSKWIIIVICLVFGRFSNWRLPNCQLSFLITDNLFHQKLKIWSALLALVTFWKFP